MSTGAEDETYRLATVTIVRTMSADDIIDAVSAVDADGNDLPLAEALGMMRLAEDTLIRSRMDGESDEDD